MKLATEKYIGESDGIYGKTKQEAELELLKIGKESNMCVYCTPFISIWSEC